jgi:predicted NAD/FAD-dependent oxidoreductase
MAVILIIGGGIAGTAATPTLVLQRQFMVTAVGDRGVGSGRRGPDVDGVVASSTS